MRQVTFSTYGRESATPEFRAAVDAARWPSDPVHHDLFKLPTQATQLSLRSTPGNQTAGNQLELIYDL
jgi:hypothetical protein